MTKKPPITVTENGTRFSFEVMRPVRVDVSWAKDGFVAAWFDGDLQDGFHRTIPSKEEAYAFVKDLRKAMLSNPKHHLGDVLLAFDDIDTDDDASGADDASDA